MIQTTTLMPPPNGPMANPLLFGVAAGLAALFPPAEPGARDGETREGGLATAGDGTVMRSPDRMQA